ncbi:MAG: hypothetical protein OEO77_01445, partial [Acidimicrobiia bacterium]|nr:hypothetical protein [Acidimicrobiia bacterium]
MTAAGSRQLAASPPKQPVALDTTLRRIIVGYRAVAAVWFTSLALIALIREDPERPGVVAVAMAVVLTWTTITLGLSYRAPQGLRQWPFLIADIAVTIGLLLAPDVAGASDFYGGYPISTVLIGVYGLGLSGGSLAVVALTGVAIWRGATGMLEGDATGITGAIVVYPFIAAPVIWAVGVLRRSDRLRREAESALERERADRIRAEDRAEVAAHLHDSV